MVVTAMAAVLVSVVVTALIGMHMLVFVTVGTLVRMDVGVFTAARVFLVGGLRFVRVAAASVSVVMVVIVFV
jgi:hypothetical protein